MSFKVIHKSRILATKSEFSLNELLGQSIVITSLTHNLDGTNLAKEKAGMRHNLLSF